MSTDESGAPWPYKEIEPGEEGSSRPTWECPGGACQCHAPVGETERTPHRILFFDGGARRMPGARCRVLENGVLLNKSSPFADGSGGLDIEVRPENRVLICAINHGFHEPPPQPHRQERLKIPPAPIIFRRPVAKPEGTFRRSKAHQNAGSAHGRDHDNDYSQIFSAVAGYCAVRASSSDPFRWRKTADIYTSTAAPSFAPLVSKSGKPLPRSAYGGGAQDPQNKPLREKHIAFIPEP